MLNCVDMISVEITVHKLREKTFPLKKDMTAHLIVTFLIDELYMFEIVFSWELESIWHTCYSWVKQEKIEVG